MSLALLKLVDTESTFTKMSLRSKYSEWRGDSSRSAQREIDFTSPGLAVMGIERLLFTGKAINSPANEVWPNLYIGDISRRGSEIYEGMGITYLGIEAQDSPTFDMSANFNIGAQFIHTALKEGGKILVHCHVGVSRSATVVLAYLMLKHNMTLVEAINTVKEGRGIIPNRGFLRQLIDLHIKLYGCRN
ncbi:dual specificity protein phosphatase 26-like isoform X2 [Xyrauchen texanus]|uniref:dual specificity protein phosphatase 26-like isoform X2 n=1 Tax=Xyrauchen texanus TaxID=154827 RepID=UPI002241FAD1|nr:dual specificity protein phosphatase 26-like isoform X2 [Xyrauchen texanus]